MTEIVGAPEGHTISIFDPHKLLLEGRSPNGEVVYIQDIFEPADGYLGVGRGTHDHSYLLYFDPRRQNSIHQAGAVLMRGLMEETGGPVTFYARIQSK